MQRQRTPEGATPARTEEGSDRGGDLVWFVAFESKRLATTGGLGDAVANLSEALLGRAKVTIFMPSHGRHNDVETRDRLQLKDSKVVFSGVRIGYDGSRHPYAIGMETGNYSGVRYVLFKGADPDTSAWLDAESIYGEEITYQKMALLARALRGYAERKVEERNLDDIPSVIHMHDWHAVPAGVSAWEAFEERRLHPTLVFTSHLLSFRQLPWHYVSVDWSGLRDQSHYIRLNGSFHFKHGFREVWEGMSQGSFEKFGCYEADFVTSVSKTYLDEVLAYAGPGVGEKSAHVYNGCNWDYEEIRKSVLPRFDLVEADGILPARAVVRKRLIEKVLPQNNLMGFKEDGPLVLATGRFDKQKGVDLLVKAVPEVLKVIPAARFLFLLLPSQDVIYARTVEKQAAKFPDNVTLVVGNTAKIYQLAYLSSDVYAMPSRWEPFGITALEAMATGNPVVGASTGGIKETVIDLLKYPEDGTGILVRPEDERELARGLVSLLSVMMSSDRTEGRTFELIQYDSLRAAAARDSLFGSKLRERCIRRVKDNFTWTQAAKTMYACYQKASGLAALRASAKF